MNPIDPVEKIHRCPDTTDAASMVIKTLGACLLIIVLGVTINNIVYKQPFPEWIKDLVMPIVVGLVGILGQVKRTPDPQNPPLQPVTIQNQEETLPVTVVKEENTDK